MNKKVLTLFLAIIVLSTISIVSASDDFHEDYGVTYNVPDGYTFEGAYSALSSMDVVDDSQGASFKYTKGSDQITVNIFKIKSSVTNDVLKKSLNPGASEKTIEDTDGFFTDLGSTAHFDFIQNGKLVSIEAPSEDLIEDMLDIEK